MITNAELPEDDSVIKSCWIASGLAVGCDSTIDGCMDIALCWFDELIFHKYLVSNDE